LIRAQWWPAVATIARRVGNHDVAEDAVQDECAAALAQWPAEGTPSNPRAWLIGVARNKALDRLRRESLRLEKEAAAVRDQMERGAQPAAGPIADDQLALIFTCCHPALDPAARVMLTLRSVCGLTTSEIAASFLVPEPTMAKRLVRAKQKIRDAGIPFRVPVSDELSPRLRTVLRVIYLVFTEGHMATSGDRLVRDDLCDEAIRLTRALGTLLPDEPEVTGLLALMLLTDCTRPARLDESGEMVLLAHQDRSKWDSAKIAEGEMLVEKALRAGQAGPYQLQAAIAACHCTAATAAETDWRQIAALYTELLRHEPTPVMEANRAVAVAMAEGPAAGLILMDRISENPQLDRWPRFHVARADLLLRLGRTTDAVQAYDAALALEPSPPEQAFIKRRVSEVGTKQA
jgi:RNA polymerase sigma-70 factor (ECF subfamily)